MKEEYFNAKGAKDTQRTRRHPGAVAPKISFDSNFIALRAVNRLRVLCVSFASFALKRWFSA
jgi:hypothetical protein